MVLRRIDGTAIFSAAGSLSEVVREALRRKLDLTDASFNGDLSGIDFTGATLYNAEFRRATLDCCNFTAANLRRVYFYECSAELAVFHGADMDNCKLDNCGFDFCDLAGAQLTDAMIHKGFMTECSFHRARAQTVKAQYVRFTSCNMTDMTFVNSAAWHCRFTTCDFEGSKFGVASSRGNRVEECGECPLVGWNGVDKSRQEYAATAEKWARYFGKLRAEKGYSIDYVAKATNAQAATIEGLEAGRPGGGITLLIALLRLYNITLANVYYGAGNTNDLEAADGGIPEQPDRVAV